MRLTAAQTRAISARGNVLVAAGAGTGKTRTVVERCLSCLVEENPSVSLDEILMVTFTEAAAAEMRQRIRERLEEELKKNPENLRFHEQLALFDMAHIGTLHSFCLRLVRPHFYELELDPQLSVMAEEEARLLAEETLTSVLEGHFAGTDPESEAVQQLIQTQGSGSDQLIRLLVLRLHHYTQTLPNPGGWFEAQLAMFAAPESGQWREWLLVAFSDWRADSLSLLEGRPGNAIASQCAAALKAATDSPSRESMSGALEEIIAACEACPRSERRHLLNGLKEFISDAQFLLSVAATAEKSDPLMEDWQWVRGQMTTLLRLAREFGERFSDNKRELGMLDFHDLEQCALRLLWDTRTNQPTPIALQWRKKLRFVFVDEYQDINAAQDRIIQALSGDGLDANRFLVGDIKQSIYRFRLANPYIFQGYMKSWGEGSGEVIPLAANFRSREKILSFINSFFTRMMRPDLGGVRYDEDAWLLFGDAAARRELSAEASPGPRVELQLRLKKSGDDAESEDPIDEALAEVLEMQEADKEARSVALRLRDLMEEQHPVWDEVEKEFRPVTWSDIAILLRSPAHKTESYAKEFARLKVPLLVHRGGFYQSIEISDLVSLLQILDNPLQDVPMLAVLHSPLAGLNVNELATIRLAAKGPFWTALLLWANSTAKKEQGRAKADDTTKDRAAPALNTGFTTAETLDKVNAFLERFNRWRRSARQASLSRCLETVLTETHYDTWLLTQSRGEQRHANVQRLLRLAQRFDRFQRQGLFRFLCFIAAQRQAGTEPEVKPVSAENAVRLMSIHQSKGLEFPVVVVADLGKLFNLADLRAAIILDEEYGLCPLIKPPHTGKRYPSLPYWMARRRQQRELLGEELRLLYVAMTRARDILLLSASITEKRLQSFCNGEARLQDLAKARSFADWVALWFAEHCAIERPEAGEGAETPMPISGEIALLKWNIHDETRLVEPITASEGDVQPVTPPPAEALEQLQQRLLWYYPFLTATHAPAKASVTALRRRAAEQLDEEVYHAGGAQRSISARSQPQTLSRRAGDLRSAADKGSAHHSFLQLVSLERTGSIDELKSEAARMQQEQTLTPEQFAVLDFEALARFWKSALGNKISARATCVLRELQFTARFSPEALVEITGGPLEAHLESEFVIVQGVADLVVLMKRELWLLDFKTDAIKSGELQAKVHLYEPQMKLYARALAQIYQRPVTECWLYFLDSGSAEMVQVTPANKLLRRR